MEFRESSSEPQMLRHYASLFQTCFPTATHLDVRYLEWLYTKNPSGTVIGMDAWEGDRLAAHYVCVPGAAMLDGKRARVLLSLNTATHPDFQGKGIFTKLADATYCAGAERGFSAVYGVANANSTPGFVRKLGFSLIAPLDAKVGVGRIDSHTPSEWMTRSSFYRAWDATALRWRCSNPSRPYTLHRVSDDVLGASAATGKPLLCAWAELPPSCTEDFNRLARPPWSLRLNLGLHPRISKRTSSGWFDVPSRMRSSPLNLILRNLSDKPFAVEASNVIIGQLDFDAF
ncbi:MAG: hypothetical protein DDT26_01605 [Dehalococcoidia bacterium]|nr:hypothetical protein [Chloroflexota bacterium]